MKLHLPIDRTRVAAFCRAHGIRRLAIFGSALRDDFRPESDLDVLVEFRPGMTPGLAFFGLDQELSEIVGRRVDLQTPASVSRYFRDRVLAEAEDLYVEA